MNLRSWASNSLEIQKLAADDKVAEEDESSKVLGMLWNTKSDTLTFAQRDIPVLDSVTKRDILKFSSRIYDPLGLLSPVTVRAKLLMQDIWKQKVDWDEPLSDEYLQKWNMLTTDLCSCHDTHLSRRYLPSSDTIQQSFELHVFVDASIQAYGAAVYISNNIQSRIVISKNRIAPVKPLTLPKLELMAAVVCARIAKHAQDSLQIEKVTFWSDSQIVLSWLSSDKPLQRFVRNRVDEIKSLSGDFPWRYCRTKNNPADLLTRGITARDLSMSTLWESGPTWLTDKLQCQPGTIEILHLYKRTHKS
ncbi:uncharacterized protein LOC128551741 [Mercenaria mercenaria]|uniref:uncharacterized protein LOC128551741 n=1 Tax=Mercenaria mercenaria TaxID=6596 RepID=UPI00234EFBB2|nr:uncharacterized protein LOC128551741 [Mercenaria mercenaria]